MIYAFLMYSLPFILMIWFFSKVAAFMLGTYVMSFGSQEQQKMAAGNPSLGFRLGLMLSVLKDRAAPVPVAPAPQAPEVPTGLQSALEELDKLKVERQILEVRREIEAMKSGTSTSQSEPSSQVPLGAAVAAAVALPVVVAQPVTMPAQASAMEELDHELPAGLEATVVRDPHSGELIVA